MANYGSMIALERQRAEQAEQEIARLQALLESGENKPS